jgi:hypothetical protein
LHNTVEAGNHNSECLDYSLELKAEEDTDVAASTDMSFKDDEAITIKSIGGQSSEIQENSVMFFLRSSVGSSRKTQTGNSSKQI